METRPLSPLFFLYLLFYRMPANYISGPVNLKYQHSLKDLFHFSSLFIALGVHYQIKLYKEIPQNIKDAKLARGIPIDDQYIESVTTGLTYFTNTVYFNYNTFLMFLSFIIFLAITIPSKQKTSWSK